MDPIPQLAALVVVAQLDTPIATQAIVVAIPIVTTTDRKEDSMIAKLYPHHLHYLVLGDEPLGLQVDFPNMVMDQE